MQLSAPKKSSVRVHGRNSAEVKTTVSMSPAMRARFVAGFGGEKAFRKAFNNILSYAEATDGFSLSAVVRMALDAELKDKQKAAETASATV